MKIGRGAGNVKLCNLPEPTPKAGELKIKVSYAGICATDMHIINDEYSANYPVVMGHEYSGTVVETGSEVRGFALGDRVVSLTAVVTCGKCEYCRKGLLMLCPERKSIGSGVNGSFAEYLVVPADLAFKIPDNVSFEEAALTEPLACVVRSVVEKTVIRAGDRALVSGPGAIGLLAVQLASISGAQVVVAGTAKDADRMKVALELGAARVINVEEHDILAECRDLLGDSDGFEIAFECAGHWRSAANALNCLKKEGQYVQIGLFGRNPEFDHDLALKKEITIAYGYASERSSWERALRLFEQKKVNLRPLIGNIYKLEDWEKAVEEVKNKSSFKVLFAPAP